MTPALRRYVLVETLISIVINTAISIGFVYLMFGGMARIATSALIADAIPQSFMIALMSTVVPALLTRKRLRAGTIVGTDRRVPRLLKSLPVRALIVAALAAVAGLAIQATLLGLLAPPDGLSFGTALLFKAIFAGILAGIVTPTLLPLSLPNVPHK